MTRQEFVELRDKVAEQLLRVASVDYASHDDARTAAWACQSLCNIHETACRQIEAMAVPGPTHHQKQSLVKLAAMLNRIAYDIPLADERIKVVADALLEIARERGGA